VLVGKFASHVHVVRSVNEPLLFGVGESSNDGQVITCP
jgi:hypothetical protein